MPRSRGLSVGIETDFLRGNMTGIANYSFHLLNALLEQNAGLRYSGFSNMFWHPLSLNTLRTEFQQKETDESGGTGPGAKARAKAAARAQLAKFDTVRALRHKFRHFRFSRTVAGQRIDIFHALNFLPMSDPGVPMLPTVYDLSFVRYPEAHPGDRLRRLDRLPALVARAPLVQTISHFSKREIASVYGISPDRIFVAPPAASRLYRPLGPEATAQDIRRFDIQPDAYFLMVGTLEPRKNLRTVICAYARLPASVRQQAPLVIVGGKGWGELNLPAETAWMVSDGTLRFLGSVSDAELRSLYEGAIALLFPSIYEGFGMPVVEALACGTAVAHSVDTAMDEISGPHAIRVSATDVVAWTEAIQRLLDEKDASAGQRDARIEQSRTFSWAESAKSVTSAYATLARL